MSSTLFPQHQRAIDKLTEHFRADPNFLALIIGGSIVKGWARPDSDVDFVVVATDEEYARRAATNAFQFFSLDFTDYEGGYVDGKVVDLAFLRDAAAKGSDPARSAFVGAFAPYSDVPELPDLLAQITTYPEHEVEARLQSFSAQVEAMRWYIGEADKRHDPYLANHVSGEMLLFGGRMILAHNRVFYPYHKWFTKQLEVLENKPADFMARFHALLARPCKETSEAFYECLNGFTAWPQAPEGWPARFMTECEWTWRDGRAALADI